MQYRVGKAARFPGSLRALKGNSITEAQFDKKKSYTKILLSTNA
jgi:hypothetical protein